jgi:hypothetical protein
MLIAIKYNEDDFYTNSYYAKVGGISLSEVNILESEYLKYLEFDLYIRVEEYSKYLKYLTHFEN